MNYHQHTQCRVCGNKNLKQYLDLGRLPLSNNLCSTVYENPERFPLNVLLCEQCGLSQLSIVVNPEILFGHYVYRSSISEGYKSHCYKMAIDLKERYGLSENSFHIDLAGNDGALLKEFKKVVNGKVLNIDPAQNLHEINESQDVRMYCVFWGIDAAKHLINTHWPKPDLITATNVFAHVDKVDEFLEAVKMVLNENGVLILEFPYLVDFIENNEFDTVYFEHLSYFAISPLNDLCNKVGLTVMDVERQNIHGGSVRVHIGYGEQRQTVKDFIDDEAKYRTIEPYIEFANTAYNSINNFRNGIADLNNKGYKVAAFAASAKFNTLTNCASITGISLKYIVDQTPEKIGKYSPGTHIPIVGMDELINDEPDYLVVGSWNFLDEIVFKCRNAGYKGKFISPIPHFQILDNE